MRGTPRVAERLAALPAFSYRDDPAVPTFADDRPIIVYDGVCILCSKSMRRIANADRRQQFRFMSAQSSVGQAVFRHYSLDPNDFETVLLLDQGRAYGKFDAIARIGTGLGGVYRAAAAVRVAPGRVQDWAYDAIAKNRYRIFGRTDQCMMPDASWRSRVIE
jgi:predicted DCC family thiol-disulfide oxidoreductase YuxK